MSLTSFQTITETSTICSSRWKKNTAAASLTIIPQDESRFKGKLLAPETRNENLEEPIGGVGGHLSYIISQDRPASGTDTNRKHKEPSKGEGPQHNTHTARRCRLRVLVTRTMAVLDRQLSTVRRPAPPSD
ncbi:unnamed protein product [Danaus chrysippus]|uniref:(African queen) hypothetical protein n=1 Tax=Danaus chrysippus TaxID=151541 RepID=A0A8J2R9V2_9NEOP|nr:unnamed protein product [Danaus chrysippus]